MNKKTNMSKSLSRCFETASFKSNILQSAVFLSCSLVLGIVSSSVSHAQETKASSSPVIGQSILSLPVNVDTKTLPKGQNPTNSMKVMNSEFVIEFRIPNSKLLQSSKERPLTEAKAVSPNTSVVV